MNMVERKRVTVVVTNGIIMALYLALTILVSPVASGAIQFRISESLNHLVVFNRKYLWGILAELSFTMRFLVWAGSMSFWRRTNFVGVNVDSCFTKRYKKYKDSFSFKCCILQCQHVFNCIDAESNSPTTFLANVRLDGIE